MAASTKTYRCSVAQCCTVRYDAEETLKKMRRLLEVAVERDQSQLIVFPEAFLGGYPKHATFGCVVGERNSAGRDDYLSYYNASIDLDDRTPGSVISRVESLAKKYDIFIVSGVIERDGGTLYCSAIWVDPENGLVGKRRKLNPTASERLIWGQGGPEDVKVITTSLPSGSDETDAAEADQVKISATICWENYMPLLRTRLYELGTQLYCVPTVDGRDVWQNTMAHIALEGRCFVLSACQMSGKEKDHEPHSDSAKLAMNPEDIKIAGGSIIIDPLGNVLAGPLRGKEGVLTATIDLDQIIRGKMDLDVVGHYARKDIFHLSTREAL